jgi:uncharacterized repeat protein (TIGR01451 family)
MISVNFRTACAAAALLSSLAFVQVASAAGTAASTSVDNRATVNYSVGGVAQTPIESSPAGNSNPGAGNGADTSFVVDNRIDLSVDEESGGATTVSPGQLNVVASFTVTNDGNAPQGFQLSAANLAGGTVFGQTDNTDVNALRVFVDHPTLGTVGAYDANDTDVHIDTLNADASVVVFVVADVPLTATNGQYANVSLTARAAEPGTAGATLEVESAGADTAGVDIVFGDTGRDATESADDQFAVQSAALSITKTSTLVSDPFNGTTNPKAIPGAVLEYVVTVANTGALPAGGVNLSDTLDGNLSFLQGQYNGNASDVQIQVGAAPATFCVAEDGADANADGCNRTGQTLSVNPTVAISVPPAQSATVRFRVTIN